MDSEAKAIQVFNEGGIVMFPTDTAFGIGCRIDKSASVDRLFALRRRPKNQAMPVLVSDIQMALSYLDNPGKSAIGLMHNYWPGALTVICNCQKEKVYNPVRGDGNTIGVRMPNHALLLKVIAKIGVPVLGSSANFHGEETPYDLKSLNPDLVRLVDYVLPGESTLRNVSTVVDCTTNPFRIVRQGWLKLPVE